MLLLAICDLKGRKRKENTLAHLGMKEKTPRSTGHLESPESPAPPSPMKSICFHLIQIERIFDLSDHNLTVSFAGKMTGQEKIADPEDNEEHNENPHRQAADLTDQRSSLDDSGMAQLEKEPLFAHPFGKALLVIAQFILIQRGLHGGESIREALGTPT